jgi:hypothetical protein
MNERLRDLFAVDPAEFVRARDALAKELRARGNEAEAKEVAALRRPTAALWAVNQLARKNPRDLEQFLDASEQVRHAQVRGGSGDDLRAAMAAQRRALATLEQAAADVMRGAGAEPSPGAVRTVQSTLQAAGSGPADVRQNLLHGTLREALEPAGFEALLGAGPVRAAHHATAAGAPARKSTRSAGAKGGRDAEREAKEERRAAERDAKRQLAEARKRAGKVRAAEKRLRGLEQRARKAEAAAQKARDAVGSARAELERLRT